MVAIKKQKLNKQGGKKETKDFKNNTTKRSSKKDNESDIEVNESSSEEDSSSQELSQEDLSSQEESSEEEFDDELDENDEVDVNDVSSSDSDDDKNESEDDDEVEDDEEVPKLKKNKNKSDGSEGFATALSAIVGSKLKAYDRSDPIMARSKVTLKKLESDKLEAKAKRALAAEKREILDRARVKNLLPSSDEPEKVRQIIEKEKKLKKIAQKGVVKLFNAVLSTQIKTNQEISKEKLGLSRKEEIMTEISKEKFLDLVQAAGQE